MLEVAKDTIILLKEVLLELIVVRSTIVLPCRFRELKGRTIVNLVHARGLEETKKDTFTAFEHEPKTHHRVRVLLCQSENLYVLVCMLHKCKY
jgi:hypothetical protein